MERQIKPEAVEKGDPVKKRLTDILSKVELRALMQASSVVFTEWNDPENEDYDRS